MGLLSGLLSVGGSILTGLFGGGSGGSNQAVVSQLAEKILPETEEEKQAAALASEDESIKDVNAAREYNAPDMPTVIYQPGMGLIPFILLWSLDVISRITDVVNHIIRPGFFIYLLGGFVHKWPLPDPKMVDPQLWTIFEIVVTFFFGARMIVKDIPAVIAAYKDLKK